MVDFLVNLDKELQKRNLNRSWLAREIKANPSTVNTWFLENRLPRLDIAHEISKTLKVSLEYLLTGVEPKPEYDDPIIEEICEYVGSLDHDDLIEARTVLKYIRYMKLVPEKKRNVG